MSDFTIKEGGTTVRIGLMVWCWVWCAAGYAAQPNIVFFIADDMTYTDASVWGHPDVKTPTLERLAREGMTFSHTFTATAMCSPTRHMIYTGQFPLRSGGYPNHAKARSGTRSVAQYLSALGYRVGLAGKVHVSPEEVYAFEYVSRNRLDFDAMDEFMTRDDAQPYCLIVASKQPHTPWDQGDPSQYRAEDLTLPKYFVDTPETRATLVKYYAEITYMDGQLAQTLALLDAHEQTDNTLVMFSTEQGSTAPHAKWTLYDAGIRGGMIARWPGTIAAGTTSDALVQYSDFLPTWIEAAGGEAVAAIEGKSLMGVLRGETETHHEYVYGLQTTVGISFAREAYPIRSIRDGRYKLIWNLMPENRFTNTITENDRSDYFESWRALGKTDDWVDGLVKAYQHRPEFELYDLEVDADELVNVADAAEHSDRLAAMHAKLKEWMAAQGDAGIETELNAPAHQVRPRPLSVTSVETGDADE